MTHPPGPLKAALTTAGVVALLRLAVLSVDPEGRVAHWNRGAEELFGHRWEDVFGQRAHGLLPAVALPLPLPPRQRPANAVPVGTVGTGGPDGPDGPGGPEPGDTHRWRDVLEHLTARTAPVWAGAMSATDRDGKAKDVLWWSYRLTEPDGGHSLLALAANAKPLRAAGPRLALGDQLRAYSSARTPGLGELRIAAGFAGVHDPELAERLGGRLAAILPRISQPRLRWITREVVRLGYPVLEVDGAPPLAVLPREVSAGVRAGRARPEQELPGAHGFTGNIEGDGPRRAEGGARPVEDTPSARVRRARRSGQQTEERYAWLVDAAKGSGTSLDLHATAQELCTPAVPRFADLVAVELVDPLVNHAEPAKDHPPEDGTLLRRVAVAHHLPLDRAELLPQGELLHPVGGTLWGQFGELMLTRLVDPALAEDTATDLGAPQLAPLLANRSVLSVPLVSRGTVLGRMLFVRGRRRPFDHEDVRTATKVAAEGALRLHNARTHLLESQAAAALQRSMLPTSPPKLPGVRIAHHYRPGDRQAQVGGDWFDAVQLPGGRVALIVGDVMGHGLHSAAVMGQLRTAVQTMAALDLPPAQLLRHLDNLAHRLGEDHLATCVYAVYDPVQRTLTLANAGHVPPVLYRADGPSELLQVPEGAPIGVGGVPFETVEIPVPDGSWLVLCTDGLVEVREEGGIGAGLAALCENVIEPDQTPEEVCDAILGRLHTEDRSDDVALLVAKFEGIPSRDVAQWPLELDFSQVRVARALTRKQLADWGLNALADLTELLVSELVTNAVKAATRDVELRLMRVGKLLVEVSDDDHNLPLLRRAESDDEDGRGLALVSNLSRRWGTSRQAVGKVVWFELALPHGADRD
ncbi:SpoIIE family protein phosphatase [Streptomyces capparidis]